VPIYEYQCSKCNGVTERLQGIHERALKKCPSCGGRLEKKMSSGAFVLKGSGFYANDYPNKSHNGGNGKAAGKPASCPAFAEASAGKPAEGGKVPPACAGCPKTK
jgi:putative FmdB family regulatory protein